MSLLLFQQLQFACIHRLFKSLAAKNNQFQHSKAMLNEHYPLITETLDEHGQFVLLRQFYGSGQFIPKIEYDAKSLQDKYLNVSDLRDMDLGETATEKWNAINSINIRFYGQESLVVEKKN